MGTKTKGTPSPISITGISSWPIGIRPQRLSINSMSALNVVLSMEGIITAFTFFSSAIEHTQLHYTSIACPQTNFAEFNKYIIFQSYIGNKDIALAMVIVYTTIGWLIVYTNRSTNHRTYLKFLGRQTYGRYQTQAIRNSERRASTGRAGKNISRIGYS